MITVEIFRDKNKNITRFSVKGHANAGKYGNDIVCASISILSQTTVLALHELLDLEINYEMEDGWLYCELPPNIDRCLREKANIILNTMVLGVSGTIQLYSEFIEIIDKEV